MACPSSSSDANEGRHTTTDSKKGPFHIVDMSIEVDTVVLPVVIPMPEKFVSLPEILRGWKIGIKGVQSKDMVLMSTFW